MIDKQPEALRLAHELIEGQWSPNVLQNEHAVRTLAAAELRRQHERIAELEAQLIAIDVDWQDAAKNIAINVARNCGTVPQLVFPHIFLGLKELFDKPAQCLHRITEPVAVTVPGRAIGLSGDSAMAHQQCRAVVQLALAVAEVYVAKATMVAHDGSFTDHIGQASAAAMEWLGDELNRTDATTEDDEWMDQIFEAAQERWPVRETT